MTTPSSMPERTLKKVSICIAGKAESSETGSRKIPFGEKNFHGASVWKETAFFADSGGYAADDDKNLSTRIPRLASDEFRKDFGQPFSRLCRGEACGSSSG
jgi:hypothetical protein